MGSVIDWDYSVITLEQSIDEDSDIQRYLQMAYTVLDSAETCQAVWDGVIVITDRMQCAGASTDNSGCNGDSGGPLAVNDNGTWYLVGNTSWGSSTCNVRYPSAWSKNVAVYSWIQQT